MPRPDGPITCAAAISSDGRERLTLDIDGHRRAATLHIGALSRRLIANITPRALDLIEIAAFVYAADSAITRGGTSDSALGRSWRRRMNFRIPVRDHAFWSRDAVRRELAATLGFLSDDDYAFAFTDREETSGPPRYFDLKEDDGFCPDEVLLFSGGLDSFAGALEEIESRRHRVALVSHWSATKLEKAQSRLITEMRGKCREGAILQAPVRLQMQGRDLKETTHRSRSFFFAAVGAVVASLFGLRRARFYENGVISLNLPPSGQIVGARATRSTHPRVLTGFQRLFGQVFEADMQVDNPFIWKTKTEVVELIRAHGGENLIKLTRSCANVREMTHQHPHCGRCSQCLDRRVAMLAAGLEKEDTLVDYAVDPLLGARTSVEERELVVGYVENARRFATMTPGDLLRQFGEVQRVLDCFEERPEAVTQRVIALHQRHAASVQAALRRLDVGSSAPAPDSLVTLAGPFAKDTAPRPLFPPPAAAAQPRNLTIGPRRREVRISGVGAITGASADLLVTLAMTHLQAAGDGARPEDYPSRSGGALANDMGVTEATARRRVLRARKMIKCVALENGETPPADDAIIESLAWRGYRLNPDLRVIDARAATGMP